MMNLKRFVFIFGMALVALLSFGCREQKKGDFVVAAAHAFPPYAFTKGTEIIGVDVDICREVADRLHLNLKVEACPLAETFERVSSGQADAAIGGLTITEERSRKVQFSVPYVKATQVIVVKKGSAIKSDADLRKKGMRIGCIKDSTAHKFIEKKIVSVEESVKPAPYVTSRVILSALLSDRIDAAILDEDVADTMVKSNEDTLACITEPLTEEDYAIALPKDRPEVVEMFNQVITEFKESGKLSALIEKNQKIAVRVDSGI